MPLSDEQIKALYPSKPKFDVTRRNMVEEHRSAKNTENWLSPLNKIIWHSAFKARKKRVVLRDGRAFLCDYTTMTNVKHVTPTINVVIVTPEGPSFVPCGVFDLDEVTHKEWVTADETKVKKIGRLD